MNRILAITTASIIAIGSTAAHAASCTNDVWNKVM